jgi:hypothetical protein
MNKLLSGVLGIVMALVFVAAGVFAIITGVGRIQKMNSANYVETQATITKIETNEVVDTDEAGGTRTEYEITVEYTVDGKKFVTQLNETPKEFYEGMELAVRYNVDKPTDVILPGNGGAYIVIALGVVGILAGAFLFLKNLRGR